MRASFRSDEGNLDQIDPGHMVFFTTFDHDTEIGWFQVRPASPFTENTIRIVLTIAYGRTYRNEDLQIFAHILGATNGFSEIRTHNQLGRQIFVGVHFGRSCDQSLENCQEQTHVSHMQ